MSDLSGIRSVHLSDMGSDAQTYMKKDQTANANDVTGKGAAPGHSSPATDSGPPPPAATNPGPPPPGVCIFSDPFPYAETCRRFHGHIEGMDIPTPLPDFPPDILGMMYAALHKRHKDLESVYDFSAVDVNIVEVHLKAILKKVLQTDTSPTGEALTDQQKEDILAWTGWGEMAQEA